MKSALFVAQNGSGIGHLARVIAIARRLTTRAPVLLSTCRAVGLAEPFGIASDYFPSAIDQNVENDAWNAWLTRRIHLLCDQYDADRLVFDGNDPYAGLLAAIAGNRRMTSIWVRRGLWADTPSDRRNTKHASVFDTVAEPGDFAATIDDGALKASDWPVTSVPPVVMVDRKEMLTRRQAARTLGLDPGRVNVLVQIAAGNNRDTRGVLDAVNQIAAGADDAVRFYMLVNPLNPMTVGHDFLLRPVSMFPAAFYFNAFDFSLAAAGYNTYHEVLFGRLPTIFLPNQRAGMDNQAGRAAFAECQGLCLVSRPDRLSVLAALQRMLQGDDRESIRARLAALSFRNGARELARHIEGP